MQLVANSFRAHKIFIFSLYFNFHRNELEQVLETTLETVLAYYNSQLRDGRRSSRLSRVAHP